MKYYNFILLAVAFLQVTNTLAIGKFADDETDLAFQASAYKGYRQKTYLKDHESHDTSEESVSSKPVIRAPSYEDSSSDEKRTSPYLDEAADYAPRYPAAPTPSYSNEGSNTDPSYPAIPPHYPTPVYIPLNQYVPPVESFRPYIPPSHPAKDYPVVDKNPSYNEELHDSTPSYQTTPHSVYPSISHKTPEKVSSSYKDADYLSYTVKPLLEYQPTSVPKDKSPLNEKDHVVVPSYEYTTKKEEEKDSHVYIQSDYITVSPTYSTTEKYHSQYETVYSSVPSYSTSLPSRQSSLKKNPERIAYSRDEPLDDISTYPAAPPLLRSPISYHTPKHRVPSDHSSSQSEIPRSYQPADDYEARKETTGTSFKAESYDDEPVDRYPAIPVSYQSSSYKVPINPVPYFVDSSKQTDETKPPRYPANGYNKASEKYPSQNKESNSSTPTHHEIPSLDKSINLKETHQHTKSRYVFPASPPVYTTPIAHQTSEGESSSYHGSHDISSTQKESTPTIKQSPYYDEERRYPSTQSNPAKFSNDGHYSVNKNAGSKYRDEDSSEETYTSRTTPRTPIGGHKSYENSAPSTKLSDETRLLYPLKTVSEDPSPSYQVRQRVRDDSYENAGSKSSSYEPIRHSPSYPPSDSSATEYKAPNSRNDKIQYKTPVYRFDETTENVSPAYKPNVNIPLKPIPFYKTSVLKTLDDQIYVDQEAEYIRQNPVYDSEIPLTVAEQPYGTRLAKSVSEKRSKFQLPLFRTQSHHRQD